MRSKWEVQLVGLGILVMLPAASSATCEFEELISVSSFASLWVRVCSDVVCERSENVWAQLPS